MDTTPLIGMKFRRNKYGLSSWVDLVCDVWILHSYNTERKTYEPIFKIKGKRNNYSYSVSEVIFIL